jgi:hypothetical protein
MESPSVQPEDRSCQEANKPSSKKRETHMILTALVLLVIAPIVICVRAGALNDEQTAI